MLKKEEKATKLLQNKAKYVFSVCTRMLVEGFISIWGQAQKTHILHHLDSFFNQDLAKHAKNMQKSCFDQLSGGFIEQNLVEIYKNRYVVKFQSKKS